jgi:hypothetical protein
VQKKSQSDEYRRYALKLQDQLQIENLTLRYLKYLTNYEKKDNFYQNLIEISVILMKIMIV